MRLREPMAIIGGIATGFVSIHIIATYLQNTPDSYNLDLRPYTAGWPIPSWRFFAPNPGIQNVHLLVRTRPFDTPTTSETAWYNVTPKIRHQLFNVAWNPRSRGPKALFDVMQQLSVMRAGSATFSFIATTVPYALVSDAARAFLRDRDAYEFQYMLLNYFPSASPKERLSPVLVSEWLPVEIGNQLP